jgi:methylmalonyl-CoA mutase cobalamin-binding subunit
LKGEKGAVRKGGNIAKDDIEQLAQSGGLRHFSPVAGSNSKALAKSVELGEQSLKM